MVFDVITKPITNAEKKNAIKTLKNKTIRNNNVETQLTITNIKYYAITNVEKTIP
jgi:hypothetical protein